MSELKGNFEGLKTWMVTGLQSLYEYRDSNTYICDEYIADMIAKVTDASNREISVIISKRGLVEDVVVGDYGFVPVYGDKKGTRCIHTHPGGDFKLSKLDISALSKTNLDAIASVGVNNGIITGIQCGYKINDAVAMSDCYASLHDTEGFMDMLLSQATKRVKNNKIEETSDNLEKVILIGLKSSLEELYQLVLTAGGIPIGKIIQNLQEPHSETYIGKGKLKEVAHMIQLYDADGVVLDDEITPSQHKRISEDLGVKVIDRTTLILDIFAKRANTKEGKLQVELAQLSYMIPRLTGKGRMLSRLGGGIGTRGPGETKLETDRRHILRRITYLKKELDEVSKRRSLLRNSRKNNAFFTFSIVGYTNAGKSTLINTLTKSSLYAKDQLFATLDPAARAMKLPSGTDCILVDTVGFIDKLPHDLINAFKSTLEEITMSDCIVHVIDGSNPEHDIQAEIVYKILKELGAEKIPVLEVLNKADKGLDYGIRDLKGIKQFSVSALTGLGIDKLAEEMDTMINGSKFVLDIDIPYSRGELIAFIHENTEIIQKRFDDEAIHFTIKVNKKNASYLYSSI